MKHNLCNIEFDETQFHTQITPEEIEEFCNDPFYRDFYEALVKAYPECTLRWISRAWSDIIGISVDLNVVYEPLAKSTRKLSSLAHYKITRFKNKLIDCKYCSSAGTRGSGYNIDLEVPSKDNPNYKLSATSIKKFVNHFRYERYSGTNSDIVLTFDDMQKNYNAIIDCLVKTRSRSIRTEIDRDKKMAKTESVAKNTVMLETMDLLPDITEIFKKHNFTMETMDGPESVDYVMNCGFTTIGLTCNPDDVRFILDYPKGSCYAGPDISRVGQLVQYAMDSDGLTKGLIDKGYKYEDKETICSILDILLTYARNILNATSSWNNEAYTKFKRSKEPTEELDE